jgi:hypothetical protein
MGPQYLYGMGVQSEKTLSEKVFSISRPFWLISLGEQYAEPGFGRGLHSGSGKTIERNNIRVGAACGAINKILLTAENRCTQMPD